MSHDRERRPPTVFKGRGAVANPAGRFERHQAEAVDDGWGSLEAPPAAPATVLGVDPARTVITYNRSPDIPFDRSINPYKAEHVMSLIRQMRGGNAYEAEFGTRMRGRGVFAELLDRRFRLACSRLGLNRRELRLDCSKFVPPRKADPQLPLF
jgi:hypothetical protein